MPCAEALWPGFQNETFFWKAILRLWRGAKLVLMRRTREIHMDHQPNDDKQITLTPEPQAVAKFILSLLEQPRRIEQNFPNKIFIIDYTWCRNLIEICEHRMDQHKYSICSFSCNIFYKDGRVDSISSKERHSMHI
jgi:hypothetical protein